MMLHIRANTTLGRIMRCNLDWTQLYSGLDIPILESTDPLTYITDNWFLQLRNFLITINGTISIKNVWRPQLERNGDCILMKIFQKSGLPPASLRLVNNWRLYFQVSTLSDICNATGTTILLNYRKRPQGIKRAYIRTSKLRWPRQAEPGPYGFRYWMYCLKHCCGMDTMGNIPRRLGNWIVSPTSSNSIWTSYMSTQTKLLYLKCVDGYQVFIPTYSRTQSCRYSLQHSSLSTDVPADAIPVGVLIKETSQEIDHRSIQILSAQPAIQPATFDQFVNKAPGWSADLLQNWSSVEINTIQQAMNLIDNPLLMVSDGGLRFDQGTYGVVIADLNTILIQNQGIAHGSRTLHSSFRAESYGMISGCHTLYSILQFHKITVPANKQLQIFSDNLGLITRINKHLYESMSLRDHGAPDIDIELQILSELRALRLLGFRISVSHVKGHQDRTTLFQNLPREAQLNVEADTLATESFDSTDKSVYQPFPANNTALKIGDTFITSKQRETLHSSHLSQALRAHMVHQFDWSEGLPSQIWWSIHGKAIQLLSHNDRMRIQKFIFNRWATNSRQAKYFSHILPVCSTCSHSTENEDHILRCLSPSRAQLRVLWLNDLDRFLSAPHTHDAVRQAILLGINAWLKNTKPPTLQLSIPDASTQLLQAYEEQAIIGWDHFLRGRLSLVWAHLAQFHLETQGISNICMSAERWGRRIISINWIGVLSLWECRNSEEHGDTQEEQTIKSKAKLISEAIAIQATKFPISYVDREYLFRSIEDLEKYSLGGLTNWIRNARHLINTYKLDSPDFRKRTRYKPNEEEETT